MIYWFIGYININIKNIEIINVVINKTRTDNKYKEDI